AAQRQFGLSIDGEGRKSVRRRVRRAANRGGIVALVMPRILDILLSSAALLVLSPVMIACAIAVRLSSPGPVLFRQARLGLGGKPFQFLKF
ncbi:sugar transferase, partial [bacterium]|nr:sugar transferase [bacterium]